MITEGIAAFVNLTETEVYNGKDTGAFSIVINMEDEAAAELEGMGVKVKEYKNQPQRKFKSKFDVQVVDVDGDPISKNFPYGSKVKLLWEAGNAHPTYGVATYLKKVKVLEMAEIGEGSAEDNEDF